jgi:monoamine oxidase
MARTPLMRSIIELVRDHERARRRGVPLEAVREEKAAARQAAFTRRQFLGGAAALAATAAAFPRLARAAQQPRIAIIGGGIAGLTTALTLRDNGLFATVYEAAGFVGGRMHSNNNGFWNEGQVSEWCGELIDTNHKTVQTLAKRFNLPLDDLYGYEPNGSEDTYYFLGQYYPKSQADSDFQPVHQALQNDVQAASYPTLYNLSTAGGQALDHMSLSDWIDSRVPGGHGSPLGLLLDTAYNEEYGSDTFDQSSLNLVYLLGYKASPGNFSIFGASDERYHIRGGNGQLPQAMAAALGDAVVTGTRLQSIAAKSGGGYTLTFSSGSQTTTVTADIVAMCVPFAVLRTLDYSSAGFDTLKNTAIQELGRGHNGKLQLQFDTRWWNQTGAWPGISNGNSYSDVGYMNTWDVSRAQPGASGIIVDYTGGSVTNAMSTKTPFTVNDNPQTNQDVQRFLSQIERVFPGLSAHWNGKATSSLPHLDPNLLASYSYWRVGQYTQFSGYEKARQGSVFFAGEHTSQNFQGFMEGGASEGARCASDIIAFIGKK